MSESPTLCVLVIDDEPVVGRLLRRVLRGHNVEVETHAPTALARLRQGESFDVIVCDLMMPELAGWDLYYQLDMIRPGLAERVLFITGELANPNINQFIDGCQQPLLEKPFDIALFRDELEAFAAALNQRSGG